MFLDRQTLVMALLASAAFATLSGCKPKQDSSAAPSPTPAGEVESRKEIVRFKRGVRIKTDFSTALGLSPDALCTELGLYSCTDLVHPVSLGGVSPYAIGLYEPLPRTGVSTPIIVERVALNGCKLRANQDIAATSNALIFRNLPLSAAKITDIHSPAVKEAIDSLYRRSMQRHATDAEVAELEDLYADVAADSTRPARDWALLSCFAVLTSEESLFY